ARVLRQRGDHDAALGVYKDLEQLGSVSIAGQPAALIARQGRCRVREAAGDAEELRREAADLSRALNAGGWPIDRATFDLYRDMLEHWGGPLPSRDDVARTEAAVQLWRTWRRGDLAPRGRRILREATMLAVWSGGPEQPAVWLAMPGELEASLS